MNSKQIAEALAKNPTSAEAHRLILACDERRGEIRARISAIQQGNPPLFAHPQARAKAIASGPEAVAGLEREIEELNRELNFLAQLEPACFAAQAAADIAAIRKAIPVALRKLPGAIDRVRSVLLDLDAAIADLNVHVECVGQYEASEDKKFPLTDDGLAELLALRNELWQAREVRALMPPGDPRDSAGWPRSWALFYDKRDGGHRVITRRPGVYLPDVVTGETLSR